MNYRGIHSTSDEDVENNKLLPGRPTWGYSVEEQALIAKTGIDDDCEDAIYLSPNFAVVIDGATSKTSWRWNGKTGGKIATEIIKNAFNQMPANATVRQAADSITDAIQLLYRQHNMLDIARTQPVKRATACFVAVSFERHEVWSVGDCQYMLDQKHVQQTKACDQIAADARALFLESEIAQGKTIQDLCLHDTGRDFILPLLERQMYFQNNTNVQYGFSVIDGFEISATGIQLEYFPSTIETIVLASDGYPYLQDTLNSSEQALQKLLQNDPLLFRTYRSTKGISGNNISFDDRSYVKIRLGKGGIE